jgi:hypothetical protein
MLMPLTETEAEVNELSPYPHVTQLETRRRELEDELRAYLHRVEHDETQLRTQRRARVRTLALLIQALAFGGKASP